MKKLLFSLLTLATALSATAQIKIEQGGYAIFGKNTGTIITLPPGPFSPGGTTTTTPTPIDTLANATFLGRGPYNGGGYIAFGPIGGVKIGETAGSSVGQTTQQLMLSAPRGIICESGTQSLFACTRGSNTGFSIFRSYLDMRAPSFIVDSKRFIVTK